MTLFLVLLFTRSVLLLSHENNRNHLHFVLCGLIKSIDDDERQRQLLKNFAYQIQYFRNSFSNFQAIVVCNADDDACISAIRNISNMHGLDVRIIAADVATTTSQPGVYNKERLEKMSFLRNQYLANLPAETDIMAVLDFDLIGEIRPKAFEKGIISLLSNPSVDAVACNGRLAHWKNRYLYLYYDTIAFLGMDQEEPIISWLSFQLKNAAQLFSCKRNVFRVKSAFGGLVLYKFSKLSLSNRYSCENQRSEHISYHKSLKQVLNKEFYFNIKTNLS